MKRSLLIIVSFLLTQLIHAQEKAYTDIRYDERGGIKSVKFSSQDKVHEIPKSAQDFFEKYLEIGTNDRFKKKEQIHLRNGNEVYNQYYCGIRVEGGCYVFHYNDEGKITRAHGKYVNINNLNPTPSISQKQARDAFATYNNISLNDVVDYYAELIICNFKNPGIPILAYKILLNTGNSRNYGFGYVNAMTGEVFHIEKAMKRSSQTGVLETRYYGFQYAQTDVTNGVYRLYDSTRGDGIHTRDMKNISSYDNAVEVTDNNNIWYREEQTNNADMAFDVHWGLQKIFDRFQNAHSITSYDNNGKKIIAYTNDNKYNPNAGSSWNLDYVNGTLQEFLSFGGGSSYRYPYSSLDVVAHEYGHAIEYHMIGWNHNQDYLEEGFSDIWGGIMEYRCSPDTTGIWKISEKQYPFYVSKDCLRNIANPKSTIAETQMETTFMSSSYLQTNDEYERSGVFSHWFYLLVKGESGVNDLGHYFNTTGIGMDIAENLIVKAVYEGYLIGTTSYPTVREAFIDTAEDMNIPGLVDAVCNAWYAVGVDGMNLSISGPTVICDESVYTVEGLPSGYTVEWSLSDSNYDDYCLEMDTPNTNQCTITKDDYDSMIDATLTAYIKYNGTTVQTVTKEGISAYNDIIGHYISGSISSGISYTHILPVTPGSGTIITSPVLIGATVSYSSSGTTPSYWAHISSSGEIVVIMPSNSNGIPIVFNIYDTCGNYYNLYLFASSSYSINVGDNSITVMLNEYGESLRGLSDDLSWTIEIRNATTGELMTTQSTTSRSASISIAGWPKGMYVVRVTVGKESWSEKILIK